MIKLYSSALHPGRWVAYAPKEGWVVFPARENGWEERRPVRGLDPLHLRHVPLETAAGTGVARWVEFAKVA
jgi:hypothetical protein